MDKPSRHLILEATIKYDDGTPDEMFKYKLRWPTAGLAMVGQSSFRIMGAKIDRAWRKILAKNAWIPPRSVFVTKELR